MPKPAVALLHDDSADARQTEPLQQLQCKAQSLETRGHGRDALPQQVAGRP